MHTYGQQDYHGWVDIENEEADFTSSLGSIRFLRDVWSTDGNDLTVTARSGITFGETVGLHGALGSLEAKAADIYIGDQKEDDGTIIRTLGHQKYDGDVILYSDDGSASDRIVYGMWQRGSRAQSLLGGLAEWQKQYGNFLIVSSAG